jgi:hypothetical protein
MHKIAVPCRLAFCLAGVAMLAWVAAPPRVGAQDRPLLDPRVLGLEIPPGELQAAADERVLTTDNDGAPVVAKTHVKIGDHRIVLLPDGELVARSKSEAEATERPFAAISSEKLIERLRAAEFSGFKVKKSQHYVYFYNTSEEFAFGTGRILESMLPGVKKYMEGQNIDVHEPEVPLVVVMFRTSDDFQRYRRMPEGVVAYYQPVSNRVVMYEELPQFEQRRDLALQQAISTVAHEGAHQILHNIGVQQRLSVWPMWLGEGLAEFFAPTSVGKKLTWKGAAQVNDLRMFELEQYIKARANEGASGDTVQHTVLAGQLTSTGYASAWSLTHYLATKRRADFTKYLREVAETGPLEGAIKVTPPGLVRSNATQFEKHFGDDYQELERKLVLHLQKLPYNDPFAGMPHYVAMLSYTEGKRRRRQAGTFHSRELAEHWVEQCCEQNPLLDASQAVVQRFPNRAAAETFARAWLSAAASR